MPADNSQTERLRRLRGMNQALGPSRPSDQSTLLSKKFGQMEYTRQTPTGETVTQCCGSGSSCRTDTCPVNFDAINSLSQNQFCFVGFTDATHMKIRVTNGVDTAEGIFPFAYAQNANEVSQICRTVGIAVASNRIVFTEKGGTYILEKCGAIAGTSA